MGILRTILLFVVLFAVGSSLHANAGPYPPAAGKQDSSAVHKDDPAFAAWASGWIEPVVFGKEVDEQWKTPQNALGKAEGTAYDIMALGAGGTIVLTFDNPIMNGNGWDFAVFENSYSDTFLELAFVEVSSDGKNFIRFENDSLAPEPVGGFGSIDPTDINGLAGKYKQGYGTPFDLQDLADRDDVVSDTVNLSRITHVRIIDIAGDGTFTDTSGDVIYDPYPTTGSAGFDLDAVGVRYENTSAEGSNSPPNKPSLVSPATGASDEALAPVLKTDPFSDPDTGNLHLRTRWQISNKNDFTQLVFETASSSSDSLTSLTLPQLILEEGKTYWWRVKFYDGDNSESQWSNSFNFATKTLGGDTSPKNGLPDDKEITVDWDGDGSVDASIPSVKALNKEGKEVRIGVETGANVSSLEAATPVDPSTTDATNRPDSLPSGLISFKLKVADSNTSAYVTIHLSEPAPFGAKWYKYDPVNGWREYGHATFNPDGTSVVLELKDGSEDYGDIDGLKNGVIVDPGGVGYLPSSTPPPDGEAGFGGQPGCFIATAAYGSQMEIHVKVLRTFRDTYLIHCRPGRFLVTTYYRHSPPLADFIAKYPTLKTLVKIGLTPVVGFSYAVLYITRPLVNDNLQYLSMEKVNHLRSNGVLSKIPVFFRGSDGVME